MVASISKVFRFSALALIVAAGIALVSPNGVSACGGCSKAKSKTTAGCEGGDCGKCPNQVSAQCQKQIKNLTAVISNIETANEAYETLVAVLEKKVEDADEDADMSATEAKIKKLQGMIAAGEKNLKVYQTKVKKLNNFVAKLGKMNKDKAETKEADAKEAKTEKKSKVEK